MKIAIGCFLQESHSFSPIPGSWNHFGKTEILRGTEILDVLSGTRTEIGGILSAGNETGADFFPLISARSTASAGPILREVFEAICDELLTSLSSSKKIDGLLLVLHGAMIAEGYPDASGELLRRFRERLGPDIPIVATLDLHANVTNLMVTMGNALVGYHTAPHIDMFETGQRAFNLIARMINDRSRLAMVYRQLPMILPGENGQTTEGPYHEVMEKTKATIGKMGILDASVFSVQPWLDVPEVGCSVVIVCEESAIQQAEKEADDIAQLFWDKRRDFDVRLAELEPSLIHALAIADGPVILSEPSDSPSSGAPGDSTVLLKALLKLDPKRPCYLNIVDPNAVLMMQQAGIGQTIEVQVGAGYAPQFYKPVTLTGRVRLLCEGDFRSKGPGMKGLVINRGPTGILVKDQISLVVMSRPIFQWDPELYRSLGLEPMDAQVVQVKSPAAFRAAYTSFASEIILIDTPGVCSPKLKTFNFQNIPHPLFPIDEFDDWRKPG